jgi:hypothetical protein
VAVSTKNYFLNKKLNHYNINEECDKKAQKSVLSTEYMIVNVKFYYCTKFFGNQEGNINPSN